MPNGGQASGDTYDVPLNNIQGNITPGFKRAFQEFVFLRFPNDVEQVRDWLTALQPFITTADDVADARKKYRDAKALAERPGATEQDKAALQALVAAQLGWINVAFTRAGLEKLAPAETKALPQEFREGLLFRLNHLKMASEDTTGWQVRDGLSAAQTVSPLAAATAAELTNRTADAVLIVGANDATQLSDTLEKQLQLATARQLSRIVAFHGESLGEGREHLGFVDAISQPDPKDLLDGWFKDPSHQTVAPGEFIVGCTPETRPGASTVQPSELEKHGSYVAIMRIDQDVDGFWKGVEKAATHLHDIEKIRPMSKEFLAAKIVGRWPSGALLENVKSGEDTDPAAFDPGVTSKEDLPALTADYYKNDRTGFACPISAHVRRALPRLNNDAHLHRIIRRGITYQDGDRKGLIFVSYQASLRDGFEHVQAQWLGETGRIEDQPGTGSPAPVTRMVDRLRRRILNIADFLAEKAARLIGFTWAEVGDLLNVLPPIGARPKSAANVRTSRYFFHFPFTAKGYTNVTLPVHTTVEGGGYFFAPSISGLVHLAGGVTP